MKCITLLKVFVFLVLVFAPLSISYAGEAEKQIQRQLQSLGYYNSSIDGIWGQGSKRALDTFLRDAGGLDWDNPNSTDILRKASELHSSGISLQSAILKATSKKRSVQDFDLTDASLRVFPQLGHVESIRSVVYSPDVRYIASSSRDNSIKIWDSKTYRELHNLKKIKNDDFAPDHLAFSPNGRFLAGTGGGGAIVWDVATGLIQHKLEQTSRFRDDLSGIAYSPNGRYIVAGIHDGFYNDLIFWYADSGKIDRIVKGERIYGPSNNTVLAYSPDGRFIASGSDHRTIKIWNITKGKEVRTLKGHSERIISIAFSPDGRRIVSSSSDGIIKIWSPSKDRSLKSWNNDSSYRTHVTYSPDGRFLVSPGSNNIKIFDANTGVVLRHIENKANSSKDEIGYLDYSPNGRFIVSGDDGGSIVVWDAISGKRLRSFGGSTTRVQDLEFRQDGTQFATVSQNGLIATWGTEKGRRLKRLKTGRFASALAYGPDNRHLAVKNIRDVRVYDLNTGKRVRKWRNESSVFQIEHDGLAYSSDGEHIVFSSRENLEIGSVETGKKLGSIEGGKELINFVAYSPNSQLIASSTDYDIKVMEAATGKTLLNLEHASSSSRKGARTLVFNNDGSQLVTVNLNNLVVCNTSTGKKLWSRRADEIINVISYSPVGDQIISGGNNGSISIWKRRGEPVKLIGHTGDITSVAFNFDSRFIVSSSKDNTVRYWDSITGKELLQLIQFIDGEYLVVTPDGFFNASSPEAAKHINVVKGLKGYGIENFYDQLYRPDLVAEALKGDPDGKVARAAAKLSIETLVAQGLPPELELISPEGGSKLESDQAEIKVGVNELDGGIGRVEFRVNGKVQGSTRGLAPIAASSSSYDKVISQNLLLPPGKSRIDVVAYNKQNTIASNPVSVTVSVDASASRPAELFVLSVGVNDYFDDALDLSYAVSDARAIADFAGRAGQGSYAKVHTKVVTDAEVTQQGLEAVFSEFESQIKPHDAFLFFIAGHGKTVDGRCYFLPQDFRYHNASSITEEGLSQEIWQDWFARIPAQRALLLYDTCESGSMTATQTRGLELKGAIDRFAHATGRAILTASTDNQPALEGYRGHGIFTYALLEAFAEADANSDQTLLTTELATYVDTNLPRLSKEAFGHSQIPQMQLVGNAFPIGTPIAFTPTDQPRIPKEPTHFVIKDTELADSSGRKMGSLLKAGMSVRLVNERYGVAEIAISGEIQGFVPIGSLLEIIRN